MKIWRRLFRRSARAGYELPQVLDHLPLKQSDEWRRSRLIEAAERHGKPFKCAAADLPHEMLNK